MVEEQDTTAPEEQTKDSSSLVVDLSPSGKTGSIIKGIKKEGEPGTQPWKGVNVFVHYTGWLLDGTKFDSSRDRNQEFKFQLGKGQVIKGWDLGVASMTKGEVCMLTIASEFAYGKRGSPPTIPGGATLQFEIELIRWEVIQEDLTGDKGVMMTTLKLGEMTPGTPNDYAQCKIHIRGSCKGNNFEERDVDFVMCEGTEANLLPAIERAVKKMQRHDKVRVVIQPNYYVGMIKNEVFENMDEQTEIEYEVFMYDFQREKEVYELDDEERMTRASNIKAKALDIFKSGNYERAVSYYERMATCVDRDATMKDATFAQMKELRLPAHLNAALCFNKLKDYMNAKKHCDIVISEEETNVKALYRRAEALIGLQELKSACNDLKKVMTVEPKNAAAQKLLHTTQATVKKQHDKEKAMYQTMFNTKDA